VRENRTHGSEGGDGESRFRPLSAGAPADLFHELWFQDTSQNWLFLCLLLKTAHQRAPAAVPETPYVLKTRFF
jgi:hypothetical protein